MKDAPQVTITNRQRLAPVGTGDVTAAVQDLLRREKCPLHVEIVYVDNREIRLLNRRYLGHRGATDVIAFPTAESFDSPGEPLLGEVVVSVEKAIAEAKRRGLPLDREVLLYTVHGVLHLLGYDDHAPADVRRMRRAESAALRFSGWRGR